MKLFHLYKYLLYLLSPEQAHNLAIFMLKYNLIAGSKKINSIMLSSKICNIDFLNPVGLAAGFDKNALTINSLSKQNFGFLELGTVTDKPQTGNKKPRLFRLTKEQAIINMMGFNNCGKEKFLHNFQNAQRNSIPLGINIGKNKDQKSDILDYLNLLEYFWPYPDYITINISSPNTPNLREIQKNLAIFMKEISLKREELTKKHGKKAIFLKISPNITDELLADICEICKKYKIDALIISNTSTDKSILKEKYHKLQGGLSGKPIFSLTNQKISEAYKILQGKVAIIGVGGISNAQDAYHKIKLGANLVQIYSAIIFQGLNLVTEINQDLISLLKKDGFENIQDAVGTISHNEIF